MTKKANKYSKRVRKVSKSVYNTVKSMTNSVKKTLRKGKKMIGGAECDSSPKIDHNDPSVRKFGCKQDKLTPDCI